MTFEKPRLIPAMLLLITAFQFSCQHQDYRLEVAPGQQGQAEVRRVPFTAQEQAARDREQKVRDALAQKSEGAVEPNLAALESIWPKLSAADRTAVLEMAQRAAAGKK